MRDPHKPSPTDAPTDTEPKPAESGDTPSYDPHFPVGTDDFAPATGDGERDDPLPF